MKATILVRDLVKLIAKHGDCDVQVYVEVSSANCVAEAELKCVDEVMNDGIAPTTFELYGEEK